MSPTTFTPRSVAEAFAGQGLATPPIPGPLVGEISQREEWLWSTRSDITAFDMYLWNERVIEELTSAATPYWAASFAGHGANSYSMNLFVVQPAITLLLQEGWAGVYMKEADQRTLIEEEFGLCSRLLEQASSHLASSQEGRLVIAASGFRGGAWGWLERPVENGQSAQRWLSDHSVRAEFPAFALAALQEASLWLEGQGDSRPVHK